MNDKINQINLSIEEKGCRLKEKAERSFASIIVPSPTAMQLQETVDKGESVPPISYILYGIAISFAIGILASDSKFMCLVISVASAYGGYRLANKKGNTYSYASSTSSTASFGMQKNEVTSNVLDIVKKITKEWEEFMELKQREIQSAIAVSLLNDNEKDSLSSKVFIYEVFDISLSEFSSMANSSLSSTELMQQLSIYKEKVVLAIDNTVRKQIAKYNSLKR